MSNKLIHLFCLLAGSVGRVIGRLDFGEPLHTDGMDLGDAVLERHTLDVFGDLAIPECPFQSDELPFLESLANFERLL